MHRLAVDIDLRRIHAWSSDSGRVMYKEPDWFAAAHAIKDMWPDVVLFEIASPTMYDRNPGRIRNRLRWALWNISAVSSMVHELESGFGLDCLVSPSSLWTKGHAEELRHQLTKTTAKNHDLRECEAMLYYHSIHPEAWVPLPDYLASI